MNRFLVFAYDNYYPSGGMNDLHSSHETLEEAVTEAERISRPPNNFESATDNVDVFDVETMTKVSGY